MTFSCSEAYDSEDVEKPYFMCEYSHSRGYTMGSLDRFWDYIENHGRRTIGGCTWDWMDQSQCMPGEVPERSYYGGDFGDRPNDGEGCCEGLITAYGEPTPKLAEVRKVYQYVDFALTDDKGRGLKVTAGAEMGFSALHMRDWDLVRTIRHNHDMNRILLPR